ncbi:MAG: tetratricopeptide repeat protein [Trichodesmium sp. MAG_R04]|jgi:tetratricopeptide (TPR) repeat protein|nr:tetratricopeptide repeat protein [Trichodesmium sp. MAG_R04]
MNNKDMNAGQLLKQANQLKRVGKLDKAIALYHQVIEINPNFTWAYNNLGDAFVKQGNIDNAVAFYSQSLKNNSNSAWLYYCLGEALAKQGDLETAVKYLQKAIDTKPNFYKFYNSLGQVLTEQGNFDEAIANYQKATELNSEVAHSYLGCCLCYMYKKELDQAQNYLLLAIKFSPKNEQIKLYSDFFKILDELKAKIESGLGKDIFSFIDNSPSQKKHSLSYHQYFSKILKLVSFYEPISTYKSLRKFPNLDKFHFCISEVTLPGMNYLGVLKSLHAFLQPENYVEIGVETGKSFRLSNSSKISVGIDPKPRLEFSIAPYAKIFPITSDEFFQNYDLSKELEGSKIDFAFIDGLHIFEQALQDFINIEKYSYKNTVVCFHDTLPLDEITSRHDRVTGFWSGDVWKVVPILKQYRPELEIFTIPTKPTGLTIVTNLNPDSTFISDHYDKIINEYMNKEWVDNYDLRYAMLSVTRNSWNEIVRKLNWVKEDDFKNREL